MSFGPIVASPGLAKNEIIGTEDLAIGSGSDGIHGSRLEIHKNSAGNVPAAAGLIVINVNPLELKLRVAAILTGVVNAMFVADDLPELGADLVAALAALDVEDFSHL